MRIYHLKKDNHLGLGFFMKGVDNFAHIGGLIGGVMITMALGIKDTKKLQEYLR